MAWLITGGSGYLGSNLVKRLISENIDFHILDLVKPAFDFTPSDTRKFSKIDIRSPISAFAFLDGAQFEGVIHLAALKDAASSSDLGSEYWSVNVTGTQNILELASRLQIPRMLFISSAAVYGNVTVGNTKISESHACLPVNNYGRTKLAAEYLLQCESSSRDMKITSFRLFNLVGGIAPGFIPGTVQGFPKLLYSFHKEQRLVNLYRANTETDDYTCVRDYVNVEDVVDAYLKLLDYAEKNNSIGAFNISSEDGYTTLDLFNLIQEEIGASIKHKIISEPSLEIVKQLMDSSLLKHETGWTPKYNMKNNIGEITRWYLNNI
jgi:UDP-glucose 4-epimerase